MLSDITCYRAINAVVVTSSRLSMRGHFTIIIEIEIRILLLFDASPFMNISDCVVIISEMNKYLEIKTSEWGLSCIYKTCCPSYKIQFKSSSNLLNNQNSPKGLKNEFSGEDEDLLL